MSDDSPPVAAPNKLLAPAPPRHGPTVAVVVVIFVLLAGGLYFALERVRERRAAYTLLPYIPSGTTTIIIKR